MRGGWDGPSIKPNYYKKDIQIVSQLLQYSNLSTNIIIDCSHSNSFKNYKKQIDVVKYINRLIKEGNDNIIGIMLESNIYEGKQLIDKNNMKYGVSITDGCISFEETSNILHNYF